MNTLLEILEKTTAFFVSKGIADARLQAEQILAHGLGLQRLQLYLNFDRPLSQIELEKMRPMVARRAKREPLQHIIGQVAWRYLELKCDARALIPRPDTEGIVDWALELFKGHSRPRILEIGVGTGAISLALAQELPEAHVIGVDISPDAIALARENAELNQMSDRIQWLHSDLFDAVTGEVFDLIISNPPYIASAVIQELEVEVREYDPSLALDGGPDGLDLYRRILQQSAEYLNKDGYLLCEIGYDQAAALALIQAPQLQGPQIRQDYGSQDRFALWQKMFVQS